MADGQELEVGAESVTFGSDENRESTITAFVETYSVIEDVSAG